MKKDFQETIDDYVLGKMSVKDRSVFEKEASQEKEIQEQLELTQNVCNAIKSRHEKLVMMQKWEKQSANTSKRLMRWASSIVGIAAVFLFGFFLLITKEEEEQNLKYEGMKIYGTSIGQQTFENVDKTTNMITEEWGEDDSEQWQQMVEIFVGYLSVIGDKDSPASAKETLHKKALNLFMDAQLAKVLIEQKNGNRKIMPIGKYLQRLKYGIELPGILQRIEVYKVEKESICEMNDGRYRCNIEVYMFFSDIRLSVQNGLRFVKTTIIDSHIKEALEKNGYMCLGNVDMLQ